MTISSVLRTLLCLLIDCDFDDWKYTAPDSCWQVRTCKRDGYQEKREMHDLGEWQYDATHLCWQFRTCSRDGYQEWRKLHMLGEWQYETPNSCWQVRICVNHGVQERRQMPHQFSEWEQKEYIKDVYEYGAQGQERRRWDERRCIRCGYIEEEHIKYWIA